MKEEGGREETERERVRESHNILLSIKTSLPLKKQCKAAKCGNSHNNWLKMS